ncbi:MAG: hypothetical protein U9Q30_09545 [Campylobacterota bacterium]|nr:hypothetical protein [Campylobacterota bacterium]
MRIKAFSLIEVIFIISIVSIIFVVAVPKFGDNLSNANSLKIKNDILLIRNALFQNKNKQILALGTISNSDIDNIINSIITLSSSNNIGQWNKISSNSYIVWIDNNSSLEFTYDISNNSFSCDENELYCKEYN